MATQRVTTARRLLDDLVVGRFRERFRGDLLHPGDDGYEAARKVWNGMIDRYPAVIARCTGAVDVAALGFAREHDPEAGAGQGLPVAVRGGGHNVAGNALCDGGIVIDLLRMKGLSVDPVARTARAEPGLTLGRTSSATTRTFHQHDRRCEREDEMPTTLTDAMRDLLDGRRYAILATQNEDGSIHLTPVWYLFSDGRFYVDSPSTNRKSRNVAARPGATIIVDARQPGGECWVSAAGMAQLVEGGESQEINTRIVRRYLTDAAMTDARIGPAFIGAVEATIRLTPEVWHTWRLRDMDDEFFGGLLASTPDQWFRPVEA